MKYIFLRLLVLIIFSFIFSGTFALVAQAQNIGDAFGDTLNKIPDATGYEKVEASILPKQIGLLIGWVGFLGVVLLINLVLAGYEYMTARGQAERIENAKKRIRHVIIAAVIITGMYIAAAFVVYIFASMTGYQG